MIKFQMMPVQTKRNKTPGSISSEIYMKAYEVYSHIYGKQDAMIIGKCRGGFFTREIVALLYAASFPKETWETKLDEALAGIQDL